MGLLIVMAALGLVVALVAALVIVGLRLQRRGGRAPLLYLSMLAGLGLVFGLAGVVAAAVLHSR